MDPDVTTFAQVAVVIVFLVGSLVTIGLVAWKVATKKKPLARTANFDDGRLEQLQQSIDAIAVEVERIAEAQRFSAKLLAERNEPSGVPR
jgi:Na+(H+)/acetate symporter ActP